jgi:oligoribonuclease NrnB/cAMP/cGMP phosphodiesterase (DHH superfamily)
MPKDHGSEPPYEDVVDKDVLVLDFSWRTREQNDKLASLAKSFQIYDHHKTAQTILDRTPYAIFDMERSGAGLTWDYLFGKDSDNPTPRPFYVDYVEDRDLWNWALPNSKEVNAHIMSLPMTIEAWETLDNFTPLDATIIGQGILRHIDRYVKEVVEESQRGFIQIGPGKFLTASVVNCPYMNCSEVGNVLAQTSCIGVTWFERQDGMMTFSLRSVGDIDVSEIAKTYLGGGHRNAAGFRLTLQDGRELIDKILGR